MSAPSCSIAAPLAARLRSARAELTGRWLERISSRIAVDPAQVFPSDDLLDHMPLLVNGIADFLEDPSEVIPADSSVVFHARELGALRHAQGFSEYQILKEFEILGGIIYAYVAEAAERLDAECSRAELMMCAQRVFLAVSLIQQATTARFLELAKARVAEREDRLRAFHRALTHEMRNRIGATLGAGQVLQMVSLTEEQREQLAAVIVRNADSMRLVLENLLELSRTIPDTRQERRVRLPAAAAEVARQLRDMAASAGVQVRIGELSEVEVSAAAVELCLMNLVSNGIKYADPAKDSRYVCVRSRVVSSPTGDPIEAVVEVRDNGLGIPVEARERLFERFFRAHETALPSVEGTGLGLNLVRDTVEALGGRIWTEHLPEGTVFAFALPCRRASDGALLRDQAPTMAEPT